MPQSGSDFVTAPELSPLFGRALAAQLGQALQACGCDEVWEFGAGTGALAEQLLDALGTQIRRYRIVDLSGTLRARQAQRLAAWGGKVEWLDQLPEQFRRHRRRQRGAGRHAGAAAGFSTARPGPSAAWVCAPEGGFRICRPRRRQALSRR